MLWGWKVLWCIFLYSQFFVFGLTNFTDRRMERHNGRNIRLFDCFWHIFNRLTLSKQFNWNLSKKGYHCNANIFQLKGNENRAFNHKEWEWIWNSSESFRWMFFFSCYLTAFGKQTNTTNRHFYFVLSVLQANSYTYRK